MASSNTVGRLRQIIEGEEDPRAALLKALGDISKQTLLHAQVLVATHPGSKYHAGTKTILRTDRDLMETQFQGSVGLVIGVGPGAFVDAPGAQFYGMKAKVGDWVLYRPSDGMALNIRQVPCRLFEDGNIKMVVDEPGLYW